MTDITVPREKFDKVLADVENLIGDVASLLDQDEVASKRMEEIKDNPSIGKNEKELGDYIKKRGVKWK